MILTFVSVQSYDKSVNFHIKCLIIEFLNFSDDKPLAVLTNNVDIKRINQLIIYQWKSYSLKLLFQT